MYELLIGNQLRNKVKLFLKEILNGLDIVIGNFLYILYVRSILLAKALSYIAQALK